MLPPRKRAKTKEEKEQRKVERIMRNRKAAHASREKKRKYIEHLEGHISLLVVNIEAYKHNQDILLQGLRSNGVEVEGLKQINQDIPEFKFDSKSFTKRLRGESDSQEQDLDQDQQEGPRTPLDTDSCDDLNITPQVKLENYSHDDSFSYSFQESQEHFDLMLNYVSPVSINDSPVNSLDPIDLHNSEVVVFCFS